VRGWDELQALACHPQILAFSHVLRSGESNQTEDAFHILYGGGRFDSFADHPRIRFPIVYEGKPNYTTAAGAFQIIEKSWNDFTAKFGPMDFSPGNQLLCTVWLIDRAGALDDVIEGRINAAIRRLGPVWTSLKLSRIQAQAPEIFQRFGGSLSGAAHPPATQKVTPMLPILAAIIPTLIQAAPDLIRLLGGGEQSQKNAVIAEKVAQVAIEVTGKVNAQAAAEEIAANPASAQAFKEGARFRHGLRRKPGGRQVHLPRAAVSDDVRLLRERWRADGDLRRPDRRA
jgi:muramidase (phage lysozyme)